jgi:hypothetical protein
MSKIIIGETILKTSTRYKIHNWMHPYTTEYLFNPNKLLCSMFLRRQGEARRSTPFQPPRRIRRAARRRHTHFDKSILDTYKFSRQESIPRPPGPKAPFQPTKPTSALYPLPPRATSGTRSVSSTKQRHRTAALSLSWRLPPRSAHRQPFPAGASLR